MHGAQVGRAVARGRRRFVALAHLASILVLLEAVLAVHQTSDRMTPGRLLAAAHLATVSVRLVTVFAVPCTTELRTERLFPASAYLAAVLVRLESVLAIHPAPDRRTRSEIRLAFAYLASVFVDPEAVLAELPARPEPFAELPGVGLFFGGALAGRAAVFVHFESVFAE